MSDILLSIAKPIRHFSFALLGLVVLVTACSPRQQNRAPSVPPYFLNQMHDEAWGRRGPSYKQPVLWEYRRRGLPLLVVDKTEYWRQVVDPDGTMVWMHSSQLANRSIVMVRAKAPIPLYRMAGEDLTVIAYADPMALLHLGPCQGTRCQLKKDNIRGWAEKDALWGVDIPASPEG